MQTILVILQLIVSVALVIVVLLQKSEGGALGGLGGGSGAGIGGLFSPRGAADTLTRTTTILAILFFVASLALTLYSLHGRPKGTILDSTPVSAPITAPLNKPVPKTPAPQLPAVPAPH
jgi:preprotein translocase subunit SecG